MAIEVKIIYLMDTLNSTSIGTKICTAVFWVEIHMNTIHLYGLTSQV